MSPFLQRPVLRWAVPSVAAVAVVGGTAMSGILTASAGSDLAPRSAAQLLVDVQGARLDAISGTVVQRADLGLPDVSSLTGSGGSGSSSFSSMISGTHTVRLWYSGPDKTRVALMGSLGESDIVRNGTDVWTWSSKDNTATHTTLPAGTAGAPKGVTPGGMTPDAKSLPLPTTPQAAADQALAAIGKTTVVSTNRSANVAGRTAYELVLAPKDTSSLIGQVRIAIDSARHVPLRVQIFAKNAKNPAFEVAFTQVDFARPDAAEFRFTPPPGAKVTQQKATPPAGKAAMPSTKQLSAQRSSADRPKVVGTGWTSIVIAKVPNSSTSAPAKPPTSTSTSKAPARQGFKGRDKVNAGAGQLTSMLALLPKVSGSWGSGRLLSSTLFSALLTDDGRVLVGAVTPQALYAAAAK